MNTQQNKPLAKLDKPKVKRKSDWCGHETMQLVNGEGVEKVVAKFCPRCRGRYIPTPCNNCGAYYDRPLDEGPGKARLKYCSPGCRKEAARARAKEKKIEENKRRRDARKRLGL